MPIIHVSILSGRPAAMKQTLLRSLAEATSTSLGVPLTAVRVILTEVAPEHWTVGGEAIAPPKIPVKE
jgi:4-oxalocrotonate tautomerase